MRAAWYERLGPARETLMVGDVPAIRLLGSDDFPASVKADAARELTAAVVAGSLRSTIAVRLPLDDIAGAHELVEQGASGRVLVQVSSED